MRLRALHPLVLIGVLIAAAHCAPASSDAPSPPFLPSPPGWSPAPRHDLSIDERRGGHTIARHVGRSDEQLRERLRRETNISAASTYTDLPTAEQLIARAFAASDATVSSWKARSGRRPNLVIERTEPRPVGRSLRRGQRTPAPCNDAVVVLRWDERARSPYVLTSYPECR